VPGDDDVGAHEPASRRDEAPQERHADGERRVGDDAERLSWQPKVHSVRDHHVDAVPGEPPSQLGGTRRMELDGDDVSRSRTRNETTRRLTTARSGQMKRGRATWRPSTAS
jgi:hypothetical protein